MDQEDFAMKIREAGTAVGKAEYQLSKSDADEKRIVAQTMVMAEAKGAKTNAAQLRASDEDANVYEARLARGKAKGMLAAAKSEMLAAEVEFKVWQSMLASERAERRVYGT
jgi:hypothetical protein|tara:strand:- start:1039 stop:1371 length:333 start_codon:yes stop_codon:yes gene_type:complete